MTMEEELATVLHEDLCSFSDICKRFTPGNTHHNHYAGQARVVFSKLEPLIGSANVIPAVRAILDVIV